MPRLHWTRHKVICAFVVGGAFLGSTSCVAGPFEHRNPFDPDAVLEMYLVGHPDTLFNVGDEALFQVVTVPAVHGFLPVWSSSDPAHVTDLGDGRFRVITKPVTPLTITVVGRYGARFASSTFVIMP